jgi:ketosteroid isomerase-like protein
MCLDASETQNDAVRPSLLRCTGCSALWVSPRGELLSELGDPCLCCGGSLMLEDQAETNVGVVRTLWAAWISRDLDQFIRHCHPEVEMRTAMSLLDAGRPAVYNGHAGLRSLFEDAAAACEAFPQELRAFGDRVLTLGRLGPKRRHGEEAGRTAGWVFRFDGGKMLSCRGYLDAEEALASLKAEVP